METELNETPKGKARVAPLRRLFAFVLPLRFEFETPRSADECAFRLRRNLGVDDAHQRGEVEVERVDGQTWQFTIRKSYSRRGVVINALGTLREQPNGGTLVSGQIPTQWGGSLLFLLVAVVALLTGEQDVPLLVILTVLMLVVSTTSANFNANRVVTDIERALLREPKAK